MMRQGMTTMRRAILIIVGLALFCFFTNASLGQQPLDTKSSDQLSGSITGRVVTQAGDPLNGGDASVSLVGGVSGHSAAVDESGNFKVDGLQPGLYRVFVYIPGYISEPANFGNDLPRYYHVGDSVTLTMIKGGVITGTVTTATNEPVITANVRAFRVRDGSGKALSTIVSMRERLTDDRGVYRIYGLPPGSYILSAGGPPRFAGGILLSAYDIDVPTYATSSTRETALEVSVRSGEEITADIQYRGEPGHSISGTLAGLAQLPGQSPIGGTVSLTDIRDRSTIMNAAVSPYNNYGFAFYGVPDGDYELLGSQRLPGGDTLRSEALRVKIRGADVTGTKLAVAPLAVIAGRLVFENDPKTGCAKRRATAAQETIVFARRFEPSTKSAATTSSKTPQPPVAPLLFENYLAESVPDVSGNFYLRNLEAGSYRIDPRVPAPGWYLRSIAVGPRQTTTRSSTSNVARDGIMVKSGEQLSGLTVTITEGAASVRGKVSVSEGQSLPSSLRVYLLPAEREDSENVLRFFETRAETDGSFALGNIAPGRYWLISQVTDESDPKKVKLVRQDSVFRAQLLKEAQTVRNEVSLQPCQRMTDYDLRFSPASVEIKPIP